MQPEPRLFLLHARHELLKILAAGYISRPSAMLAVERIAELLAHIALRMDELPSMLRAVRPQQQSVLRQSLLHVSETGIDSPRSSALFADADPAEPNEGDIRIFDSALTAQALCLRQIASQKAERKQSAHEDALFRSARKLEADVINDYRVRLDAKKDEFWAKNSIADEMERAPPSSHDLELFLTKHVPDPLDIRVRNVRQLRGVNTKDIVFFEVSGIPTWPRKIVMRRLRKFNVNLQASMPYEFRLLNALRACGVKVPRALLFESGDALRHPFVMMECLPGKAKLAEKLENNARKIAEQMARHLGAIHRLDPAVSERAELALPATERLLAHVDYYYDQWRDNQIEPSTIIESGFAWIREHAVNLSDQTVLVHGDYDLRNLLIDGDRISAVLDWEGSHIGHPAEDLAYCRHDAEALMPWDEFLGIYEAHSGKVTLAADLEFFSIWAMLFRLMPINRAHFGFACGEHADFLLGSTAYIEAPKAMMALNSLLEHASS